MASIRPFHADLVLRMQLNYSYLVIDNIASPVCSS